MPSKQPYGSDFYVVVDTEEVHSGYSGLRLKYEKPTPVGGGTPETGFVTGELFGTGTTKIKAKVSKELWTVLGEWEFLSAVDFPSGGTTLGKKPYKLICKNEFD